MNTRRIATAVMVALVIAGCSCIAVACYVSAWASDVMPSLLLACMIPAYLIVSLIGAPRRSRSTAPQSTETSHLSITGCRKPRHG